MTPERYGSASTSFSAGHTRRVLEQPPTTSHDHGVEKQPILVHKSGFDQLMHERDAAGDADLPARLVLQRPHLLGQVAAQHCSVFPLRGHPECRT